MDNASSWGPGSGAGGVEIIKPANPKLGKSLSAFDLPRNFVASFVYELRFDSSSRPIAPRGLETDGHHASCYDYHRNARSHRPPLPLLSLNLRAE